MLRRAEDGQSRELVTQKCIQAGYMLVILLEAVKGILDSLVHCCDAADILGSRPQASFL